MNKLEELKALMGEHKQAREAYTAAPDNYQICRARDAAHFSLMFRALNDLPQLIAVAEAAQKVCWYDFSTSDLDGDVILDMRHLQTALEPLTKDADKWPT